MTEEELYKAISQSQQSLDRGRTLNDAFPVLMRKVYVWMTLALVITAVTAFGVATSPALLTAFYSSRALMWGCIIAELALVFILSARLQKLSLTTATFMFIGYSALNGVMLSSIFVLFSPTVITKTFLITAGTFGAMAFVGYTTKKDLSRLGGILFMALIGLIIASVVNLFLRSSMFDLVVSYIGVAIFVGLTAWDSQRIKQMLATQYDTSETAQKLALMGALTLYLDFINLFLYLLRIFGRSDN